jgi:hypothetical protein
MFPSLPRSFLVLRASFGEALVILLGLLVLGLAVAFP